MRTPSHSRRGWAQTSSECGRGRTSSRAAALPGTVTSSPAAARFYRRRSCGALPGVRRDGRPRGPRPVTNAHEIATALAEGPLPSATLRALIGDRSRDQRAAVELQRQLLVTTAGVQEQASGWPSTVLELTCPGSTSAEDRTTGRCGPIHWRGARRLCPRPGADFPMAVGKARNTSTRSSPLLGLCHPATAIWLPQSLVSSARSGHGMGVSIRSSGRHSEHDGEPGFRDPPFREGQD